jgi:hypothetical protein
VPIIDAPVFSGFGQWLFSFFNEPAKNQNKEWFHAHKDENETQARILRQRLFAVELICRGREPSGGAMKMPHFHHIHCLDPAISFGALQNDLKPTVSILERMSACEQAS